VVVTRTMNGGPDSATGEPWEPRLDLLDTDGGQGRRQRSPRVSYAPPQRYRDGGASRRHPQRRGAPKAPLTKKRQLAVDEARTGLTPASYAQASDTKARKRAKAEQEELRRTYLAERGLDGRRGRRGTAPAAAVAVQSRKQSRTRSARTRSLSKQPRRHGATASKRARVTSTPMRSQAATEFGLTEGHVEQLQEWLQERRDDEDNPPMTLAVIGRYIMESLGPRCQRSA
jgi:hypothetical protein